MAGKELVKVEAAVPGWDIFSDSQLMALYGKVVRTYAKHISAIDWDIDDNEFALARRMRQELVRRVGDAWLTKWHQA